MKVADLMARDVEFIGADATVTEAAELMGELEVGALPAGSASDTLGVLTDRDILYRVVARGRDPRQVRVREVLSHPVIACQETDSIKAAMDLMAANHVRRLAVRGEGGRITGWLTLSDLARVLLVDRPAVQESLRELTEESSEEEKP